MVRPWSAKTSRPAGSRVPELAVTQARFVFGKLDYAANGAAPFGGAGETSFIRRGDFNVCVRAERETAETLWEFQLDRKQTSFRR